MGEILETLALWCFEEYKRLGGRGGAERIATEMRKEGEKYCKMMMEMGGGVEERGYALLGWLDEGFYFYLCLFLNGKRDNWIFHFFSSLNSFIHSLIHYFFLSFP